MTTTKGSQFLGKVVSIACGPSARRTWIIPLGIILWLLLSFFHPHWKRKLQIWNLKGKRLYFGPFLLHCRVWRSTRQHIYLAFWAVGRVWLYFNILNTFSMRAFIVNRPHWQFNDQAFDSLEWGPGCYLVLRVCFPSPSWFTSPGSWLASLDRGEYLVLSKCIFVNEFITILNLARV